MVDPALVDQAIDVYLDTKVDYVANNLIKTYPHGLDVEVVGFDTLAAAWREATLPADLEHVTQYIRHRPERFTLRNITAPEDHHHIRITLDEKSDYELLKKIFHYLGADTNYHRVIDLFHCRPELLEINECAGLSHAEYNTNLNII